MFEGKQVSVVVPAYNEAHQISQVIATIPLFVDEIVVVDDGSTDTTIDVAQKARITTRCPVTIVRHSRNQGVGASIRTGYRHALARGAEVVAVMAGDGQMAPEDLAAVIRPVALGRADYAKGDRLTTGSRPPQMPMVRYLGVNLLTRLTRLAAGYNTLHDSQSGYTAISAECLQDLQLERLHPGYGYPNHLLILLGAAHMRVIDVPVQPVYGQGEVSGLRCLHVAPRILILLSKGYLWRISHRNHRVCKNVPYRRIIGLDSKS